MRCRQHDDGTDRRGSAHRQSQPPFISAPVLECARLVSISCDARGHGCALQILSDDPKTPILSGKIIITQDHTVVYLYRPLLAGETITAVLTGCGAGPEARQSHVVGTLPKLPKPVVLEPLRTWQRSVFVGKHGEPGAQVYLFINGKYAGHVEAVDSSVQFFVGELKLEDKVTALQCLCTKFSEVSEVAAVTLGHMTVNVASIVRGPNPQNVVVVVNDADISSHVVAGTVHLPGGVTHPTNTPFSWVFPLAQPGPAATVSAQDYVTESVKWTLTDPPPTPPAPPAALALELGNAVTYAILKKVDWDISHVASPGAGPTVVDTKSGITASSVLPKPSGAQELYYVGCSAEFEYAGQKKTVTKMVAPLYVLPLQGNHRLVGET